MKSVIAGSVVVLVVVLFVLVVPWYPMPTSQVVPQTQTYTTQLEVSTTSYQTQTIYSMPNPVTLTGIFVAPTTAVFTSTEFNLQNGSIYLVNLSWQPCNPCVRGTIFLSPHESNDLLNYTLYYDAFGHGHGILTVAKSGAYSILIYNSSPIPITLSNLLITTSVAYAFQLTETVTTYNAVAITQLSQTTVPPYTILGAVASTILLALAMLLVVLSILVHWGIITLSTKRRKRRKR
ncbi:MAG: hypothetical protein ABSF00_10855 [Candidatus Bathyarchaeia archaeon]